MGHHETRTEDIDELLPEIIRRLRGRQPMPRGLRTLTVPQLRALAMIAFHTHCTMSGLAKGLHITLGAATGLVDRLIQQRLVTRASDPQDRRVVRLELTPAGRRAHLAAVRQARQRVEEALARLTPAQREQVREGLRLLRDALE